jgi:hypothetical protein
MSEDKTRLSLDYFYIKTTRRNYRINIAISTCAASLFVFLLYNKYPWIYHFDSITVKYFLQLILLWILSFVWTYSTIESFLTGKSTSRGAPIEGKTTLEKIAIVLITLGRLTVLILAFAWAGGLI